MKDLLSQCQSAYGKIQEWREVPDAFDLQSDRLYLHELITELQDRARKLGCQPESIEDPTTDQALNAVAFIIEWCLERLPQSEYLTVDKAAEFLNVSPKTMYAACEGSLAHYRFGEGRGTIRITREALRRWADENLIRSGPADAPRDYLSE